MNIFLVRHAQSNSNVDNSVLHTSTNMSITLTDKGILQAKETGAFLADKIHTQGGIKIWNSPYERTRQTAKIIKDAFKGKKIFASEEHINLAERQFGLIDNVASYMDDYPHEVSHYNLHKEAQQEFFVRPPLGESAYDMCLRLDFFLRCILPSSVEKQHIIVTHGAAMRGLLMMSQKKPYEWYNEQKNPLNASVHAIIDGLYRGEVFTPSEKTS
jgi:broad specificity phosphatase PhoE